MNDIKGFQPNRNPWDFHPEQTYKSLITISVELLNALALVNGNQLPMGGPPGGWFVVKSRGSC
jgi:hypothetical protein